MYACCSAIAVVRVRGCDGQQCFGYLPLEQRPLLSFQLSRAIFAPSGIIEQIVLMVIPNQYGLH